MQSPSLSVDDKVTWSPAQLATEVEGEVVLLSIEKGSYYGLNGTGSDIWRKMREPIQVGVLCEELGQQYSGDPDVITRQVLDLLGRMLESGLIQKAA